MSDVARVWTPPVRKFRGVASAFASAESVIESPGPGGALGIFEVSIPLSQQAPGLYVMQFTVRRYLAVRWPNVVRDLLALLVEAPAPKDLARPEASNDLPGTEDHEYLGIGRSVIRIGEINQPAHCLAILRRLV
jgi:hypothetical protein